MKNKKVIIAALLSLILIFTVSISATRASGAFVQSAVSELSNTVALTGVGAGNLIVLWVKWEGPTSGSMTVSDGTSSLSIGTLVEHSNGDLQGQFAYLLSANSGDRTYTVTFPTGAVYKRIRIAEYSYNGTISFDAQNTGSGTGVTPTSGNITTTGTDEIVLGGYAEYSNTTPSSPLINGVAATFITGGVNAKMWYRLVNATFTGNASVTIDKSSAWLANVIAFKVASASASQRSNAKAIINGSKVFIVGAKVYVN